MGPDGKKNRPGKRSVGFASQQQSKPPKKFKLAAPRMIQ
jgi:hypothetical protein